MNPFKPKSPNPSIKKPADATPAVMGQLNQIVARKADNQEFKTPLNDVYPFPIVTSMIKLGDTITDSVNPSVTLSTYKLKGSIDVYAEANYFNWYLGSVEFVDDCEWLTFSKSQGTIQAYDYDYSDGSFQISPFAQGGLIADPNGYFYALEQADIYAERYSYQSSNKTYYGYSFYIHLYAPDAIAIDGTTITYELEVLYKNFCNNNNLKFYSPD